MVKSQKFLKNLLTTASALALVSFSASSALGAAVNANADAVLTDGTNDAGHLDAAFNSGADSITLGGAHNLSTGGNIVFAAPGINANGNGGQTFTVGHDVDFAVSNLGMHLVLNAGTVTNLQDIVATNVINSNVTVNGGTLNLRNTIGDVTQTGGTIIQTGNVGGNAVVDDGIFSAKDVGGTLANKAGDVTVLNVTGVANLEGTGTTKITGTATGLLTVKGGHTTEVTGDLTGGVTFGTDEVITLKGAANHNVAVVTVTPAVAGGAGTFVADEMTNTANTLTFTGNIGAAASPLKLIQAKGGSNVALQGDSYIAKIDIGNSDATVTLKAANIKIANFAHADGKARLGIAAGVILENGSVLSTATNQLRDLYFAGNHVLTIEDGVDLYTTSGFSNNAVGDGSIIAKGTSTISGKVGANNTFGAITINSAGATKTLTFLDEVNLANAVTINDTDTIVFNNNVTAGSITGGAANNGTVEFANAKAANVTLAAAGAQPLAAVKVSGGDLNFTNEAPRAATYVFKDQAATITANGGGKAVDLSAIAFATTSKARNQNFKLGNGDLILGAAGTDANHFGTFSVDAGKTITVNSKDFFASIGGKDAKASFTAVGGRVDNIGAEGAIMDTVTFGENTEVFGDAYAKKISISNTKAGTFSGIVAGGAVELTDTATATFKDGSSLLSKLAGTVDSKAIVNFLGASSIKNGLGTDAVKLAEINFADNAGKIQALSGDFFGAKTTFLKTTVQAAEEVTFHGKVDAINTTFDLGTEGITFTDGVAGTPTLFKGDIVLKTTFNGTENGMLMIDGANTKVDFTGATTLNVVLKDSSSTRSRVSNLIGVAGLINGANEDNFLLGNIGSKTTGIVDGASNRFTKWTFDTSSLTFVSTDIADQVAKDIITKNSGTVQAQENIDSIFAAASGDAEKYADELIALGNTDEKLFTESVERFSNPATIAAAPAVSQIVAQTGNIVTGRIQTLAAPAALRVTQSDGVSAGAEDTLRYGAWGSPFYSHSNQKRSKGSSGYKSKTTGGTVGFDTMANDTMIVGVAATIAKTDLKHKDINSGDKTKADTLMFSIYGLQEINDDWFLQGVANFGSTKVKNTSKRIGAVNNAISTQTATAKYDSMTWGGEVLAGYSLKSFSDIAALTPMIGLDYTKVNDGGYTETGTRNQNQTVSKKSTDRLQLVAGIRVVASTIEQSGFVITPEAHAFVRQALNNSKAKLSVKLDGLADPVAVHNVKPVKTVSNLGLGINASSGTMSYGLTYDAHLAKKYVGHQGTFKVRVNF